MCKWLFRVNVVTLGFVCLGAGLFFWLTPIEKMIWLPPGAIVVNRSNDYFFIDDKLTPENLEDMAAVSIEKIQDKSFLVGSCPVRVFINRNCIYYVLDNEYITCVAKNELCPQPRFLKTIFVDQKEKGIKLYSLPRWDVFIVFAIFAHVIVSVVAYKLVDMGVEEIVKRKAL